MKCIPGKNPDKPIHYLLERGFLKKAPFFVNIHQSHASLTGFEYFVVQIGLP
jgi:hypothetical protein